MYYLKNGGYVYHRLWDRIIFNKTKEAFGGRVRLMVTGSAPISGDILDFLKVVTCAPVLEGYGSTETTGGSFVCYPEDGDSGHVGGPLRNVEFKVIDVPEMKYLSTDRDEQGRSTPRGEICIRGGGLFRGYYKDDEKTNEAIDKEGWFHTGDVGMIRPNGSLKIVDRVKNIFKLQQGEYIAPEKVENVYIKCRGISEVFVYGNSLHSFCVGIVVPTPQEVSRIAIEKGLQGTFEELC
jgi:long-chain acyl-CoA synthetase